jgi:threonine-phosphate decarboxylase
VDECYLELVPGEEARSMRRFLSANPYLVIVRAFTKTYAMPGVRLGYLLAADKALLEKIRLQQPEWSVSMLAQCAGLAALSLDRVASVNERCGTDREAGDGANGEPDRKSADSTSYLTTALQVIHDERDYVCQRLRDLGAHVYDGEAGFVLFSCDGELYEPLRESGILIRRCDGIRGIESAGSGKHFYRIGLREHSENVRLLDRIQDLLSQ